jgi:hypothetical protein
MCRDKAVLFYGLDFSSKEKLVMNVYGAVAGVH